MTLRLLAVLLLPVRLTLIIALVIGTAYFWQRDKRRCRPYLYTLCTFLVVYLMDALRFFQWVEGLTTLKDKDYVTLRAFLAVLSLSTAYWTLLIQDLTAAPPLRGGMRLRKGWMLLLGISLALLAGCREQPTTLEVAQALNERQIVSCSYLAGVLPPYGTSGVGGTSWRCHESAKSSVSPSVFTLGLGLHTRIDRFEVLG